MVKIYDIELTRDAQYAADKFMELDQDELSWLAELDQYLSCHKTDHKHINGKILPLIYKLGIFAGSTSLRHWEGGFEWAKSEETTDKYQQLNLKATLALLTAVLAGGYPYGADHWYAEGVTQKLISRLVEFRKNEPKRKPSGFLKTGFTDFDAAVGGLRKDSVTVISDYSMLGSVNFASSIAYNLTNQEGRLDAVLFLTKHEKSKEIACKNCKVIMLEQFSPVTEIMINETNKHNAKLLFWETGGLSHSTPRAIRKVASRLNIPIVVLKPSPYPQPFECPTLEGFHFVDEQLSCIDAVICLYNDGCYNVEMIKNNLLTYMLAVLKSNSNTTVNAKVCFDLNTNRCISMAKN